MKIIKILKKKGNIMKNYNHTDSVVEKAFLEKYPVNCKNNKLKYLVTDNFPQLGLLTSLKFLEWCTLNPEGVVSLPTGKTPEYFIKWTEYLLSFWKKKKLSQ